MAKEDFNLDEELNNNLDFLDDNELNAAPANNYLAPKAALNLDKTKLFAIITVIAIVAIVIIMHLNKHHQHKNQLITLPDKPDSKQTHSSNYQNNHKDNVNPAEQTQHNVIQTAPIAQPQIESSTANQVNTQAPSNQQPVTSAAHSEEHHVSWQDLKKAVTEHSSSPQQTNVQNNKNTTTNVEGFEHQANELIQQQIQAHTKENINELKTNIDNITKELSFNANQIKELQNNLKEISSSISSVDTKILNLTNTIDTLSSNVKKYTQDEDLDLIANIKPSESDLFANTSTKNTPEYVVHAVIPGRAWLKSTAGQIITVAEGDVLGDYGKIALIDASNNLVRTSSGVVFR